MQVLWNTKVKFVSVSQLLVLALCSLFGSVSGPFTAQVLLSHLGKKNKKEKHPADFKLVKWVFWSSWLQQAEGALVSLFCGFAGMGASPLHSCPASSPVPQFAAGSPVPFCTRPMHPVHHLCCLWSALIRGNSHSTFSLFAVLGAKNSQSLFKVVQLPH